jgi:hypothetical protein
MLHINKNMNSNLDHNFFFLSQNVPFNLVKSFIKSNQADHKGYYYHYYFDESLRVIYYLFMGFFLVGGGGGGGGGGLSIYLFMGLVAQESGKIMSDLL